MRLDNIIYDKDTLETAIIQQWTSNSELFNSMYPSETTTSLANLMAAYGAMLQYTIVSCLANCYTTTAFSDSAVYQLAQTLGNDLHGNVSAQVKVSIEKNNFIGIATNIPKETVFTIDNKKFFNPSKIIFPASISRLDDIVLVQGEMIEVNKTSSGIPGEKFYFSSDFMANHNYINVYVNGEEWNVADSFLDYDKNYVLDESELNTVVLKTDPDGRSYIKLGDNQLANLPAANSKITIKYISNDGADGNIGDIGAEGILESSLVYLDNTGNQDTLDITVTTLTTAYGGFSKQSIEMLRLTSPYIFGSGHRAVRRKDYEAILENKCGYLTCAVWGEYEEAAKEGTYDAIMMNMVYYTGLKTFREYPQFYIGSFDNKYKFNGRANGRRGFEGSFTLRVYNDSETDVNPILFQDTGAKGQLFINDNDMDPRDSLLPDWIAALNKKYDAYNIYLPGNYNDNASESTSTYINTRGTNYAQGDELVVNYTFGQITLRVIDVNNQGGINAIKLLTHTLIRTTEIDEALAAETQPDLPHDWSSYINFISNPDYHFATSYKNGIEVGTGFTLNLGFRGNYGVYNSDTGISTFITTNDLRTGTESQLHPVQNLMSNKENILYYQSLYTPTLQNPVQIIVSYIYPNTTGADDFYNQPISAIKFRSSSELEGSFPGTFAVFGTTEYPMPSLENIRNSTHWDKLIKRTELANPAGNINDGWTDWYPTNCFTGEYNSRGEPIYNGYKFYVIEFYSLKENSLSDINLLTISKMKFLYPEDSSVIYYNDNGIVDFNLPTVGSPGPDENNKFGYLTKDLINTAPYPLYKYNIELQNIDSTHGYKAGNILAYVYTNEKTGNSVTFLVRISSVTPNSSVYTIYVNNDTDLCANEYVETSNPVSLDKTLTYTVALNPNYITEEEQSDRYGIVKRGGSYERNTLFTVNGSNGAIQGRIASVNAYGEVTSVVLLNTLIIGEKLNGVYETTVIGDKPGAGLKLALTSTSNSGTGIITKVTETVVTTTQENKKGEKVIFTSDPVYEYNTDYEIGTLVTTEIIEDDQGTEESGDDITTTITTTRTTYYQDSEANGALISIKTENNLKVMASFIGNKIDTDDITFLDQPIMDKYNHFTTYMEFVQPAIYQLGISARIKVIDNAPISSGIILQNAKNNIRELFTLTPDYVGKGIKISDIYKAVINTKYVQWCKILTPTDNVEVPVNGILMSSYIDLVEEIEDYEQQ